jgi:hypothetical protein
MHQEANECAGYSVASDMSFVANRSLDPQGVFSAMGGESDGLASLGNGLENLKGKGVAIAQLHNSSGDNNHYFRPENFAYCEGGPTAEKIRELIADGNPPIVILRSEKAETFEDWIKPESKQGAISHAVNIVGFGSGPDPFSGNISRYFIVRDSLAPPGMHFKIRESDLVPAIEEMAKINKVIEVNRDGDPL